MTATEWVCLIGGFIAGGAVGVGAGYLWGRSGKAAAIVQAAKEDDDAADSMAAAERNKIEADTAAKVAAVANQTPEQVIAVLENLPK